MIDEISEAQIHILLELRRHGPTQVWDDGCGWLEHLALIEKCGEESDYVRLTELGEYYVRTRIVCKTDAELRKIAVDAFTRAKQYAPDLDLWEYLPMDLDLTLAEEAAMHNLFEEAVTAAENYLKEKQ